MENRRRIAIAIFHFLLSPFAVSPARAATYFLDSSVATSGNGLSWSTAWKTMDNLTGLHGGDVVNISGGSAGQTYTVSVNWVSASGASGNPITYKVSTEAGRNGVVTMQSGGGNQFLFGSPAQGYGQWVTFDGNVNGAKNLVIQGWGDAVNASGSSGIVFRYAVLKGRMRFDGAQGIELDHITVDLPSGSDHACFGMGTGAANYRQNLVHDSIFYLRYMRGNGWGDDGFQWPSSTSFYNNQWIGVFDGAYPGNQHQDGIQTGGPYVAIYNNYFENMQNYPIYGDGFNQNVQHWRIYNNLFYEPDSTGSQAISIGCDGTTCDQSDLIIANNTVVSSAHCIFVNQGTPGTLSSAFVVNNLCYNAGEILASNATQSNNITSITGITFVNPTSDWHLQASATAAIGQGISPSYLTSVYTTDKDGNPRGSAWDIGAYQFSSGAPPANTFFVRAGAAGNGSGSDWTNAYAALPASLRRGATYYIAAGSYGDVTFNDALSGTSVITLLHPTVANHGTDAGWQAGFAGQALFTSLTFSKGYYTFDGAVGGGPGSWDTGFGFSVQMPVSGGQASAVGFGSGVANITFRHTDFQGRGRSYTGGDTDLFYIVNPYTNITISYCYLHDTDRTMILTWPASGNGFVLEYSKLARNGTAEHREAWSAGADSNVIVRYNLFEDIMGTGDICIVNSNGVADHWDIYGNVFYWTGNYNDAIVNTGVIMNRYDATCGGSNICVQATNWHIYNNIIANIANGSFTSSIAPEGPSVNYVVENNIWYNNKTGDSGVSGATTADYNWFYANTANGNSGAHDTVGASNPFVNWQAGNWTLGYAIPGLALSATYNQDALGKTRGADGVWDRGAYEFSSGGGTGDTTPPSVPTNLSATAVSSSQINLIWTASTDNVGVAGYKIFRGGAQIGTSATTTFSDAGLAASTAYTYTVAAYDAAGNTSAPSTSASATTPAGSPPPTGQTLLTTQVPASTGQSDGVGVNYELGTRLQSNLAGTIAAIRFWKDASETGTHTGHLWDASGNLLATVVFTNETASGWQQQSLGSPFTIAANTEYLVSVNTGNTFYVATTNGFTTQIVSGNLSSIVGSNGRYGTVGAYPTNTFQGTNYFRDVVFNPAGMTTSACDINTDGVTNVIDVQQDVNAALGVVACAPAFDINKDNSCNVIDVQRVVNAALGGQCTTSP